MSISFGPKPTPPPPDLSREQVVSIFRSAESDALRRHTALVGSDGAGNLHIICGCERSFSPDNWIVHLRGVVKYARIRRPQKR